VTSNEANSNVILLEGVGLHTGAPARVTLRARGGPVTLCAGGMEARIDELTVAATARATTVQARGGALRVGTVEHAFAALGGMGIYEGVGLWVEGPEMPFLDGGATAWCNAIARLQPVRRAPRSRVAREAVFHVGPSRYELAPGDAVDVEVCVELEDARVTPEARWRGEVDDFRARIAPARTFARSRDIDDLMAGGLARHVGPECVVVLAPDRIHHAGAPFLPDEPARHKLLDLIGDLYLWGGPPIGRVRAVRPGHAANAGALHLAREAGILVNFA
jgi:UDP-3-O-[3-hydroxymyristoyl] N-acetylglucosamine deacetylase